MQLVLSTTTTRLAGNVQKVDTHPTLVCSEDKVHNNPIPFLPVPDPQMERNPNQPLAQDTQWKDIQKERQKIKETKESNGCVILWVALPNFTLYIYIYIYLKVKEELWKLKYFTMQEYNLQKKIL